MPDDIVMRSDLRCPRCDHREEISAVDPDSSLGEMDNHFRRDHPDEDWRALLSEVYEVYRRG